MTPAGIETTEPSTGFKVPTVDKKPTVTANVFRTVSLWRITSSLILMSSADSVEPKYKTGHEGICEQLLPIWLIANYIIANEHQNNTTKGSGSGFDDTEELREVVHI